MKFTERQDGSMRTTIRIEHHINKHLVDWVRERTGWSDARILRELRSLLRTTDPDWYTVEVFTSIMESEPGRVSLAPLHLDDQEERENVYPGHLGE